MVEQAAAHVACSRLQLSYARILIKYLYLHVDYNNNNKNKSSKATTTTHCWEAAFDKFLRISLQLWKQINQINKNTTATICVSALSSYYACMYVCVCVCVKSCALSASNRSAAFVVVLTLSAYAAHLSRRADSIVFYSLSLRGTKRS